MRDWYVIFSRSRRKEQSVPIVETTEQASSPELHVSPRELPRSILVCRPTYFTVKDVKNSFMAGKIGSVDQAKARDQWNDLVQAVEKLGYPVQVIEPLAGLEDMVFAANQGLVGSRDGVAFFVPGRMRHAARQAEVPLYTSWFENNGYRIHRIDWQELYFEGHGDAIWHHDRNLLWGGWGHRTSREAYALLQPIIDCPILLLELVDPTFYHLDTAFCVLDADHVLFYPEAFSDTGKDLIRRFFTKPISVSEADARNFACNAMALGKRVLLQRGSPSTCRELEKSGFTPVELDSSEFMKSGGSIFCMKTQIFT